MDLSHVERIAIPQPSPDVQSAIGDAVRSAHRFTREAELLIVSAKADVEALIDGTLDQAKLLAEDTAIDAWLAAHPRPEVT